MVSAHRGAGAFRHDAAVSSWLHRIVVNACLDRLRRNKAHPTTVLDDVYPVPDRTAQVETAIAVQRALMRLPVEQRAAVVAVDMHGYSVADTARLLGVAEGHGQEPLRPRPGPAGRDPRLPARRSDATASGRLAVRVRRDDGHWGGWTESSQTGARTRR